MPRPPRTDQGGLVYHILNRANARATTLAHPADHAQLGGLLREERDRSGMRLLAWCLMPAAGTWCCGPSATASPAPSSAA
jgi:putative transposase